MRSGQCSDILAWPTAWAATDAWPKTSDRNTATAAPVAALFVR
jgi:hypothetical protein